MTERIAEMIREMMQAMRQAGVDVPDQVAQFVEVKIRQQFAGERIYIAGHPKRSRAVQLAQLNLTRTRDLSEATGLSMRRVQQLMRGK